MKIICIGQNYPAHVEEMKSKPTTAPLFFLKPDSSLLLNNRPFYYPEFTQSLHYEAEIVLKISKLGKHISPEFAHRYFEEVAFGIDLTARDLQEKCKKNGWPWEISKAFEHAAPVSRFINLKDEGLDIGNLPFRLEINNRVVQEGNTSHMIYPVEDLIAHVSQYMTLRLGDLLFTGTPSGVGPLKIGDQLTGYIADRLMMSMEIR